MFVSIRPLRRALPTALIIGVAALSPLHARQEAPPSAVASRGSRAIAAPVLPVRRGVALPPPAAPPALPVGADAVAPLTVRLTITSGEAGAKPVATRQTVTRTADRIHIALGDGSEWLFERNPIDPRRVTGYAVVHAAKVIVAYSDTELRNMLGISGWTQVLTLGCEPPVTSGDGVNRIVGDLTFTRHPGANTASASWWNAAQVLPAECTSTGGRSRLVVDGVRGGVDEALIAPPASRFPGYREFDLADWLEVP